MAIATPSRGGTSGEIWVKLGAAGQVGSLSLSRNQLYPPRIQERDQWEHRKTVVLELTKITWERDRAGYEVNNMIENTDVISPDIDSGDRAWR